MDIKACGPECMIYLFIYMLQIDRSRFAASHVLFVYTLSCQPGEVSTCKREMPLASYMHLVTRYFTHLFSSACINDFNFQRIVKSQVETMDR